MQQNVVAALPLLSAVKPSPVFVEQALLQSPVAARWRSVFEARLNRIVLHQQTERQKPRAPRLQKSQGLLLERLRLLTPGWVRPLGYSAITALLAWLWPHLLHLQSSHAGPEISLPFLFAAGTLRVKLTANGPGTPMENILALIARRSLRFYANTAADLDSSPYHLARASFVLEQLDERSRTILELRAGFHGRVWPYEIIGREILIDRVNRSRVAILEEEIIEKRIGRILEAWENVQSGFVPTYAIGTTSAARLAELEGRLTELDIFSDKNPFTRTIAPLPHSLPPSGRSTVPAPQVILHHDFLEKGMTKPDDVAKHVFTFLSRRGISTYNLLTALTEEEVRIIPNISQKGFERIQETLKRKGLSLAQPAAVAEEFSVSEEIDPSARRALKLFNKFNLSVELLANKTASEALALKQVGSDIVERFRIFLQRHHRTFARPSLKIIHHETEIWHVQDARDTIWHLQIPDAKSQTDSGEMTILDTARSGTWIKIRLNDVSVSPDFIAAWDSYLRALGFDSRNLGDAYAILTIKPDVPHSIGDTNPSSNLTYQAA